jgi:hypothetical protein
MIPGILVVPFTIVNDDALIVAGFISSLKVTVITLFKAILVSPFVGLVAITSGQTPIVY